MHLVTVDIVANSVDFVADMVVFVTSVYGVKVIVESRPC